MIPNADNSTLSRASWGRVYTLLEDSTQNHHIKNGSYGTTVQGLNKFSEHTGVIKYSDGVVPTSPNQSVISSNYIPQNIREDSMFGPTCTDIYAKYTFISDADSSMEENNEYPSHFICFPDNENVGDVGNLFNTKTATIHFQFKPPKILDLGNIPTKIATFGDFDIWYFPLKLNIYHYFNGDNSILKQTSNNFAIFNKNYYAYTLDGADIYTNPKEFELDDEGNPSLNAVYFYNGSTYINTGKDKDGNIYSVISLVGAFNVEQKASGFYDITIDLVPYTDTDLSTKIYENIFIYQKTNKFERIGIDNLSYGLNDFVSSLDGSPVGNLMYLMDPENIRPFMLEFNHGEFGDIYVSSEHALYNNSIIAPTLGTVNNADYYIIADVEAFYNNNTTWLFLDKIRVSNCTDIKYNYKPSAKLKEDGNFITIEKINPVIPGVIPPFPALGANIV